jgi:hypothetical protein
MTRAIICTLIIAVIGPGIGSPKPGAASQRGETGLSLGVSEYQIRENVLNRIRHRGTLLSGAFFYEKRRELSSHKIEFHLIFSELKSRYDPDKESFAVNPTLNYRYARKVTDISPRMSLFLGGTAGLEMHHEWFGNWDDSHLYWLTAYYLGIDGILTYDDHEGRSISLEVYSPLLSLVSRPPEEFLYKVANPKFSWVIDELHSNLTLTSVHEHFAINTRLAYIFSYTDHFDQHLYWRLSYIRNSMDYSKDLRILTHSFGVSFVF